MDRGEFDERVNRHYEKIQEYVVALASAGTTFYYMNEAYEEAKQAVIASGAFGVNAAGNVQAGWYDFDPQPFSEEEAKGTRGMAAGGVAGIGAAIGAPVAAWTLVGTLGTASTGAAIGGLSGAAASSATAAWFGGGSLAAGGLGMAAAPFILTGIGAIAGLGVLGATAAIVARDRSRRNQESMDEAILKMNLAEERMTANQEWLSKRQEDAAQIIKRLIKTTAILEYLHGLGNSGSPSNSSAYVTNVVEAMLQAEDLAQKIRKGLPYDNDRIYLKRPSTVTSIKSIHSEQDSLHIIWDDPDDGESEINGYRVEYNKDGFLRDGESKKKFRDRPEITLEELSPRSEYEFTITARNPIGWGEESEEFKAQTQG